MKPWFQTMIRQPGLWVFLCVLALCLCVRSGHIYTPDEEILFRTAESFSRMKGGAIEPLGGYARVRNAQGGFDTVYQKGFGTRQGAGGLEYAQYGIGQPLLATPFVWLGKVGTWVIPESAYPTLEVKGIQYHDRTLSNYILRNSVSYFNVVVTALTAWVLFVLVKRVFGKATSGIVVALIYAGATAALPHSKTFFSEPLCGLCVLGSLALAHRAVGRSGADKERANSDWLLSGFCFGLAVLTRLDSLMFGPGLALFAIWSLWRIPGQTLRGRLQAIIRWGLPITGCLLIILALNAIRFGSPFASGYSDQPEGIKFSTPLLVSMQGFLFSWGRSLFIFSPPLLLAPVGLWFLWKRDRVMAVSLVVLSGVFFLFQCKWQNWAGGWDWGPRHILQLAPILSLTLGGLLVPEMRNAVWKRLPLLLVVTAGVIVNFLGVSASFMDAYGRLPSEYHSLTITTFKYMLPSLHYHLISQGSWDLLLPRLLVSASWLMKLCGVVTILLMGVSCWGLWKFWPIMQPKSD